MSFSGPLAQWPLLRKWGRGVTLAAALGIGASAQARPEFSRQVAPIAVAELPADAQAVHRTIYRGGPFTFSKDGTVFANRERALPLHPRGFYREYTVAKPGMPDRGPRRIVCGGARPAQPIACFYTPDHYTSFHRILP